MCWQNIIIGDTIILMKKSGITFEYKRKGDNMDLNCKKLPKSFFEKKRTEVSSNTMKDIIPFRFTKEREIIEGKSKLKVSLSSKRK